MFYTKSNQMLTNSKSNFAFFRKQGKIAGFAMKQLEKNFPKGTKGLKMFYSWATSSDEEFNLLRNIIKSI